MRTYKARGIVLHTIKYGDSSAIAYLFTDVLGRMSYMVQGGLDVSPVITHRFHYTEFEKGFEAMNSGKSGKVVLDWTTKKED